MLVLLPFQVKERHAGDSESNDSEAHKTNWEIEYMGQIPTGFCLARVLVDTADCCFDIGVAVALTQNPAWKPVWQNRRFNHLASHRHKNHHAGWGQVG